MNLIQDAEDVECNVVLNPHSVAFGGLQLGHSAHQTLTLKNNSAQSLKVQLEIQSASAAYALPDPHGAGFSFSKINELSLSVATHCQLCKKLACIGKKQSVNENWHALPSF